MEYLNRLSDVLYLLARQEEKKAHGKPKPLSHQAILRILKESLPPYVVLLAADRPAFKHFGIAVNRM